MIYSFAAQSISDAISINNLLVALFFSRSFSFCCDVDVLWHPHANECIQIKQVSASLQPGTAMNVTLKGNYTKLEGPYKAKLKSYYADSDEPKTRDIESVVSKTIVFFVCKNLESYRRISMNGAYLEQATCNIWDGVQIVLYTFYGFGIMSIDGTTIADYSMR